MLIIPIIGKCVIAMNSYRAMLQRYNAPSHEVNRILKFHQAGVGVFEAVTYNENGATPESLKSDVFTSKLHRCDITEQIGSLFDIVKHSFYSLLTITTLPIITIWGGEYRGCYSLDFEGNCLLKYAEYPPSVDSVDMCLSLFLDIESSVLVYGRRAYMEGILQVGMLAQQVLEHCEKNQMTVVDTFVHPQPFTHSLGINLRKQLLIKNIFLGDVI